MSRSLSASEKGLVHVYTGEGKGKTTAALGLALRAAGHGRRVIMVQFLKGERDSGEHLFCESGHPFEIVQFTKGNCFHLPEEQLRADVERAFSYADEVITGGRYDMVILDEVFVTIRRGLLETARLADLIRSKPDSLELILTGRGAPQEIVELADYVTEMTMKKHPYAQGIAARKGVEY